jgi:hypothetical protein
MSSREFVRLLTGSSGGGYPGPGPTVYGLLLPDAQHGTIIDVEFYNPSDSGLSDFMPSDMGMTPLMWPEGYTARRSGTELEVLDEAGEVVATSGRRYVIARCNEREWSPWPVCGLSEATADEPGERLPTQEPGP